MPAAGRNAKAFAKTLAALRSSNRIADEHEARVTAARALAEAVDAKPTSDVLWREYRLALGALMEATSTDGGDPDEDADFRDAVRTPLGNPANN